MHTRKNEGWGVELNALWKDVSRKSLWFAIYIHSECVGTLARPIYWWCRLAGTTMEFCGAWTWPIPLKLAWLQCPFLASFLFVSLSGASHAESSRFKYISKDKNLLCNPHRSRKFGVQSPMSFRTQAVVWFRRAKRMENNLQLSFGAIRPTAQEMDWQKYLLLGKHELQHLMCRAICI